ncbi:MAG: DNA-binding protein [Clostridia bacterium]|nr:DNA-binding protein [Clostridia bacterium]
MIGLKEASQRTGLSYDSLRKLCLCGQIVHIRAGTKYYVNFSRLIEFLNSAGIMGDKKK